MTIPPETIAAARDKSILDVARMCGAALKKHGQEWNGPCPGCGGVDRFWVNEAKNIFLCRASGAEGGTIDLMMHRHGVGFADAVGLLTGETAMPVAAKSATVSDDDSEVWREKARRRAWKVWRQGRPIEGGTLVKTYFERRGIPFPDWHIAALRETDRLPYWHWSRSAKQFEIIHTGPAMLAAITGPDGKFIGVHRTWLDLSQRKGKAVIADPETGELLGAKKVEGSQRGGKIVLHEGAEGGALVLGEGIESVLAWDAGASLESSVFHARNFPSATLWSGINLDNIAGKAAEQIPHPSLLAKDSLGRQRRVKIGGPNPDPADDRCLQIPHDDFNELILLGDSDSDRFTTQSAMLRALRRFNNPSRDLAAIAWAPDGQDWDDALRDRNAAADKPARAFA